MAGNGAAQADWFVNGATPAKGDLLPVLDLERSNGLTPAQLTTWVQDFLGRVYTRLGVRGDHLLLAELLEDVHG